jgi:patatin-like phospholipase/acyl hydrolase
MKRILSIDAGGIRGTIPATILGEVEARTAQPISSLFHFFVGTSSGGILVLGLNCPDKPGRSRPLSSATEVAELFYECRNRAFGDGLLNTNQATGGMNSGNGVEDLFHEFFGDANEPCKG